MGLIVQKFGGSSVADAEKLRNVARIITDTYRTGNNVVVVLSAQGDTTDELIAKAAELNPNASKRELDMLLSTGEQISCSLCAMVIESMGYPVVSLTGWQAGVQTNSTYGNARIKRVAVERILAELDKGNIIIVTGFQGVDRHGDITTLGRGGSDTSAVALAAVLHADLCQIYTDVDGVYTADPRIVSNAHKLEEITYDEMLELATSGAQVLHNRSVELAERHHVNLEVLSSFSGNPGTKVKTVVDITEKSLVSGIAEDKNVVCLTLTGSADSSGVARHIFSLLANEKINVDLILQSTDCENRKDVSFTIAKNDMITATEVLEENREHIGVGHIDMNDQLAKVSIVGAEIMNDPDIASKMFGALFDADINIRMISTSEMKVSVLVDIRDADQAVRVIHDKFYGESELQNAF